MSGTYSQPVVYFFGQGRADGTATMKDVLGGKGAGLAEMTNLGIPVPPGFTIAASLCLTYLETRQFPPWLRSQVETSLQRLEAATGRHFGGKELPLLVSVRSGAAVSMPGNDGHHPEPRPQRDHGGGTDPGERQPAVRVGQLPALRSDVQHGGAGPAQGTLRADARGPEGEGRGRPGHRPLGRGAAGPGGGVQAACREGERGSLARRSDGSAVGRHRRGLRELAHPPGGGLPQAARHPGHHGNGGQHRHDGVRQHRRGFRHRRRLHPRPVHRRTPAVRRVPAQRPGRGRRLGHPQRARYRPAQGGDARRLRRAGPHRPGPGAALPRRAGHGVHHRARQALHAADPPGPALRARPRSASPARWWTRAPSARTRPSPGFPPTTSTSCCTRRSIPTARWTS